MRLGYLSWLLGVVLLGTSCTRRPNAAEAGVRTQTLHVNLRAEPRDFDPHTTTLPADGMVIRAVMEGLVDVDPVDCRPVPAGATRWDTSADGLTWTFHLRSDARWSNGDPVTARDFVYAYQRMLSPALAAEFREQFFCLRNAADFSAGKITSFNDVGVRAANDHTLVLTLNAPVPYLPTLLAQACWFPVHRATIEKFGRMDQRATAWTRAGNLVGNGAFVLTEWQGSRPVKVVKSTTYWDRERVRLAEVVFHPIESPAAGEAALRAGQLHVTAAPLDRVAFFRRDPQWQGWLHETAALQTAFLRLNCTRAPLNDLRVRQALSLAIDREQLARRVVQCEQPAFALTPPNCAGYTAAPVATFDAAAARRLLAEAGFPDGKGFPALELRFYVFHGTEQPVVETLQQMWRAHLGISINLVKQEMKTAIAARRTGDFDLLNSSWIGDYLDPTTFLDLLRAGASNNGTGWANPDYETLLATAATTLASEARFELLRKAESLMLREAPVIPLYYNPLRELRHPAVRGWHGNLLDLHPLKYVHLE